MGNGSNACIRISIGGTQSKCGPYKTIRELSCILSIAPDVIATAHVNIPFVCDIYSSKITVITNHMGHCHKWAAYPSLDPWSDDRPPWWLKPWIGHSFVTWPETCTSAMLFRPITVDLVGPGCIWVRKGIGNGFQYGCIELKRGGVFSDIGLPCCTRTPVTLSQH